MFFRLFIFSIILSACSHNFDISTSKGRLKKAQYLSSSGQYIQARQNLEDIMNSKAPYKIKALAQLELAEISFKKEEFVQAEIEYTQALQVFSKSILAEKFQYKKALSLYKQLPKTYQRDLNLAPKSIKEFKNFIFSYPKSPLVKKAKKYIKKIKLLLFKKELYIANFYFIRKKFKAASMGFKKISQTKATADILFKTTLSTYKAGYKNWTYYYRKLRLRFPKSTEAVKIKRLLNL